MAKTFVIGDIHGAYRALRQCLDRADFDRDHDHLIALGDVADGWPDTRECVDELLRLKNLTQLLGNHDYHTLEWIRTGAIDDLWYHQGGKATLNSYRDGVPASHVEFFKRARPYFVLGSRLFVHAGIDPHFDLRRQGISTFLWDRTLARMAMDHFMMGSNVQLTSYKEVYIGHTPTPFGRPVYSCGIWLMDTGAGWSGRLSIMNIDTHEYFLSDPVPELYPGVQGRARFG